MRGADPFEKLKAIRRAVRIPISAAGGINSETVVDAVEAGADIVIVGGAITKASDAEKATAEIKRAIATRTKVKTDLFKRVGAEQVREALRKVSTANISDGNHRMPGLTGLLAITPDVKMVGTAMTVRTYPGDWAKSVEAIDRAQAGDVIVVDAGGLPPAIWGELATDSAVQRRLAGVVIYGAIRDTEEIRKRKFPAFARLITPQAGEPKGFGEIGVPITIGGITVSPGDWVVGDDDGVIVIPKREAVEIANRAMDWLEKENRIRQEIEDGKTTLGKVTDLLKWEKK
jgi:3-hexulose-6-phosphate synthase/6-phospho-3-hexuloisomerase